MGKKKGGRDAGGARYSHKEAHHRDAGTDEWPSAVATSSHHVDTEEGDALSSEDESDRGEGWGRAISISARLCMWEFGQNDPKRDSGSKLRRLGFASAIKIGQSFSGKGQRYFIMQLAIMMFIRNSSLF
jgi:hypothetical protein